MATQHLLVEPTTTPAPKAPDAPLTILVMMVPTIVGVVSVVNSTVLGETGDHGSSATAMELLFVYPFRGVTARFVWHRSPHVVLANLISLMVLIVLVYQLK